MDRGGEERTQALSPGTPKNRSHHATHRRITKTRHRESRPVGARRSIFSSIADSAWIATLRCSSQWPGNYNRRRTLSRSALNLVLFLIMRWSRHECIDEASGLNSNLNCCSAVANSSWSSLTRNLFSLVCCTALPYHVLMQVVIETPDYLANAKTAGLTDD